MAQTAAPAPARSSSPSSSPRTPSMPGATRSATPDRPATWPPSSPRPHSRTWRRPRASAAGPPTSASSPTTATARPGSGASPPRNSPKPPRSSTCSTPASTCTTSPGPWNSCSARAVEAGCKAVIGQRLKLSGMHWTVAGADAITALRGREASSQWEQIWQRPRHQAATA